LPPHKGKDQQTLSTKKHTRTIKSDQHIIRNPIKLLPSQDPNQKELTLQIIRTLDTRVITFEQKLYGHPSVAPSVTLKKFAIQNPTQPNTSAS
jgi:hypothetical protein